MDKTAVYEPGQVLGAYKVVRLLGEGGAAVVCEVVHEETGQTYALKVLGLRTQQLISRIKREAKILAKLDHPNILKTHELIEVDGRPAIVMEYVEGEPLNAWLKSHLDRDLATSKKVFDGILTGMQFAHDQGIIHRDLKPANVLMDSDGIVKIADFGIAKRNKGENTVELTKPEMALGTPAYTAPEQVQDASKVDHRADIYSMGCILFELVCRRQAFPQRNIMERIMAMANAKYTDPDEVILGLDPRIVWAIHGSLVADPDERIGDCATLRGVLDGSKTFAVPGRRLQQPDDDWDDDELTVVMGSGQGNLAQMVSDAQAEVDAAAAAAAAAEPELPQTTESTALMPEPDDENSLVPMAAAVAALVLVLGVVALGAVAMIFVAFFAVRVL